MSAPEIDYHKASLEFVSPENGWKRILGLVFKELRPDRKNWFGAVLSLISGGAVAWFVGSSEQTVQITDTICTVFLEIQLTVFSCVLTAYSILLAFLDDKYIKILLKINYKGNKSYLKAGTQYYEAVMYIYVLAILLSLFTKLIIACMPVDFVLTSNMIFNEILATILLFVYLVYSIRATYEIKSIVTNTATLCGGNWAFRIQGFALDNEEEKE